MPNKKKPVQRPIDKQMAITVYFGYGLFILTVIALLFTTVPWLKFYTYPNINDTNTTLLLLSFFFTSLAPPLVGYLAGEGATRRKASKTLHHYNGILFGVLGMWLWMVASMATTQLIIAGALFPEDNFEISLIQIAPAVIAAVITIILAIFYARSTNHQVPVIDYTPYRVILIASAIGLVLSVGLSALTTVGYGTDMFMTLLINLITPALFILVAVCGGYWILGKKSGTVGERVVKSIIAAAYGVITIMLIGQIANRFIDWHQSLMLAAMAITVVIWAIYLFLLRRAVR